MTTAFDPRLSDIDMREAPETSSFLYKGRLVTEEWTFLPLDKRQRGDYVKADVPYYHIAVQPLSYTISDGGMEGDGLEHTYASMKTAQGELTPKGSARDELVKAFDKLDFPRNIVADLQTHSAIGKVFVFKRYNRQYKRQEEVIRGELMNVPVERLPDDWAPAPGQTVPDYQRKPRDRAGVSTNGMSTGSVIKPIGVTPAQVADALAEAGVPATEAAVRTFVLDRSDLAQGDILDAALGQTLLAKLVDNGLVDSSTGTVTRI